MSEHDLEKLLGGFAADTLTPEEKQQLYSAAMENQRLFDALAGEQVLRESLADPAVRHQLLHALNQTGASGAGNHPAWMAWFRQPARLAWAGGLTAAAFAVVLGTKIYQDSLQQAARSVTTEEAVTSTTQAPAPDESPSAAMSAAELEQEARKNVRPDQAVAKKEALLDRVARGSQPTMPPIPPQGLGSSKDTRDAVRQPSPRNDVRGENEVPLTPLGTTTEDAAISGDKTLGVGIVPPAAPAPSARAHFYGELPMRPSSGVTTHENGLVTKPLTESSTQAITPEQKVEQFSQLGRAKDALPAVKPLGLRYSFLVRGTAGQDQEVDAATAAHTSGPVRLTVEPNQEVYLQVWEAAALSTPQLLFPNKNSGRASVRIATGQRQTILLPAGSRPITLTARLSRTPLKQITGQEDLGLGRLTHNQLSENVAGDSSTGVPEDAVYVVNQDPSMAQMSVAILFGLP